MKLLHIVTTYRSVITILASKLAILENRPDIDLHVVSSFEDPAETRQARGGLVSASCSLLFDSE